MKRAICYFRVSSKDQQERQSIELQKLRLTRFAKERDYEILASFEDDGISGEGISARPGFQSCLAKVAEGDVDVLLVFMIDRIGRFASRKDRNQVIELLEDSKTSVESPYEGLFRWDHEKEMNALEAHLNESRLDNVSRGIRVSEGHLAHRLAGKARVNCPYGIRQDKATGKFNPEPKEVDTLREIFDRLSQGWTVRALRDYLNSDLERFPLPNYTPTRRKDNKDLGLKKGDPLPRRWAKTTIQKFAKNDFYFSGVIIPMARSVRKGFTPIDTGLKLFPESLVRTARRQTSVKRRTKPGEAVKAPALIHGLAVCRCGWKLSLNSYPVKNGRQWVYRCLQADGRKKGTNRCDFYPTPMEELDLQVWDSLVAALSNPEKVIQEIMRKELILDDDHIQLAKKQLSQAVAVLEGIEAERTRLNYQHQRGGISQEEYDRALTDILTRKGAVEDKVRQAEQTLSQPKQVIDTLHLSAIKLANSVRVIRSIHEAMQMPDNEAFLKACSDMNESMRLSNQEVKKLEAELVGDVAVFRENMHKLYFQQMRTLLLRHIDEGGIIVDNEKLTINLRIYRESGDYLKITKQIERCDLRRRRSPGPASHAPAPSPR
jgi:DNA invertase Pin-like site-specific DNA recombinase